MNIAPMWSALAASSPAFGGSPSLRAAPAPPDSAVAAMMTARELLSMGHQPARIAKECQRGKYKR